MTDFQNRLAKHLASELNREFSKVKDSLNAFFGTSEKVPPSEFSLITDDIIKACSEIKDNTIDLIVSSPPYGIGKSYECFKTMERYQEWADTVVKALSKVCSLTGSICWQVGTYIDPKIKEYLPLDYLYVPIFRKYGFILKNRVVWTFGHGLHSTKRLSGRYEVLLWFVRDPKNYTFNLDPIRIMSKYPGKRSYKGPNKGKLSGNPLGKNPSDIWTIMIAEWEESIWNFPNVKSNHPEKVKEHPCQFPVELAERCILAFSNEGDTVLDPFSGVGTTGIASTFHGRHYIGIDKEQKFNDIAKRNIKSCRTLKTRKIGTPIQTSSETTKTRQYPDEWKPIIEKQKSKPRIYDQY